LAAMVNCLVPDPGWVGEYVTVSGCTDTAPMLIDESTTVCSGPGLHGGGAATESIGGAKLIPPVLGEAAFLGRHTPPPVVPTYRVLPVAYDGSSASDETRPLTSP